MSWTVSTGAYRRVLVLHVSVGRSDTGVWESEQVCAAGVVGQVWR